MLEGGLRCWLWLAAWFRPPALLPPTPPCWLLVSTGECASIALTFAVRSLDSAGGCGGMKNLTIEIVLKVTVFVWYHFLFWFRGIDDFLKSAKWDPFCTFWKVGRAARWWIKDADFAVVFNVTLNYWYEFVFVIFPSFECVVLVLKL